MHVRVLSSSLVLDCLDRKDIPFVLIDVRHQYCYYDFGYRFTLAFDLNV